MKKTCIQYFQVSTFERNQIALKTLATWMSNLLGALFFTFSISYINKLKPFVTLPLLKCINIIVVQFLLWQINVL